jgi:hypothetical protein
MKRKYIPVQELGVEWKKDAEFFAAYEALGRLCTSSATPA